MLEWIGDAEGAARGHILRQRALTRELFELVDRKAVFDAWIALKAGVTCQAVSNWRRGVNVPDMRRTALLRAVLRELRRMPDPVPKPVWVAPSSEEIFWTKVRKTSRCWLWTARRGHGGYGITKFRGKRTYAHRVALEIAGVDVPPGHCVCHVCANRHCVRPEHLVVRTMGEATRAARRKRRCRATSRL
jgi:hypothetical protein